MTILSDDAILMLLFAASDSLRQILWVSMSPADRRTPSIAATVVEIKDVQL